MKIIKPILKSTIIVFILVFSLGGLNLRADDNQRLFRISAGYGVPYGFMGVNLEVSPLLPKQLRHLNNYMSFSLGAGYENENLLVAMGINCYPIGRKGMIHPRLSFYYSKVDSIQEAFYAGDMDYDRVEALCLGGGAVVQITNSFSLNGDVFYLAHIFDDIAPDAIGGRFKFALGAQFALNTPYGEQAHEQSFLNAGVGWGIPYGGIGANLEWNPLLPGSAGQAIHNYFSISIGSGFSSAGSAYSIGARIYPIGKEKAYRPRVGFYNGTVALLDRGNGNTFNLEGLALSAGLLYKLSDNLAVEGDFIYLVDVFYGWDLDDLNSKLKFSLGVRLLLNNK